MGLRDDIQQLAHEFAEEANESFSLWTWLPSYLAAEKKHGDHATEYRPDPASVMAEASAVIAFCGRGSEIPVEFLTCPCGECYEPSVTVEEWVEYLKGNRGRT